MSNASNVEGGEGDAPGDTEHSNIHTYHYAISDFKAKEDDQLDLREGDEVKVLEKVNETWWWVELGGVAGYVPANHLSCDMSADSEDQWQDQQYFSSYDTLKLHLEMLHDKPRTLAYRDAIEGAKDFIQGKVVLDLGCGTGILSLFCAKLGNAAKVYAVDASNISERARQVVRHNGLSDVIEVIQSKGEELCLPEQVDLIISEWMGTLLLFELMLESVLIARDKNLRQNGVMWPSDAELFLVPCCAADVYKDKIEFWGDVYGFDFTPLASMTLEEMFDRPVYNHIMSKEDCLAEAVSIMRLKLKTLRVEDLESNEADFEFCVTKSGTFHGFGSWFAVTFGDLPNPKSDPVVLSTSPFDKLTHWKQDLLMVDETLAVLPGDVMSGHVSIVRNQHWRRHLRITITYVHRRKGEGSKECSKEFKLWR